MHSLIRKYCSNLYRHKSRASYALVARMWDGHREKFTDCWLNGDRVDFPRVESSFKMELVGLFAWESDGERSSLLRRPGRGCPDRVRAEEHADLAGLEMRAERNQMAGWRENRQRRTVGLLSRTSCNHKRAPDRPC